MNNYLPLVLPEKGEDLLEGRQYILTPLARLILREAFGLANVPTVVECIRKKVAATVHLSLSINLETGERRRSRVIIPAQAATFRASFGNRRPLLFELDLAKLDELAPFYNESHQLGPLEEDWIRWMRDKNLPPIHRKFRGCTLRWWQKEGRDLPEGITQLPTKSFAPRKRKPAEIDLNDLL